jgi:hypothetical protein
MRKLVCMAILLAAGPAAAQSDDATPSLVAVGGNAPAASLKAACLTDADEGATCKPKKLRKVKVAAPYKGFGLIQRATGGRREELLGIQTDAGWVVFTLLDWGTDYSGKGTLTISSAKVQDVVPGGSPEVVITGRRKTSGKTEMGRAYGATEQVLWVCGIGASGAPSCAEAVTASDTRPADDEEKPYKFKLGWKLTADGKLERTVKGTWPASLERTDYETTLAFSFP